MPKTFKQFREETKPKAVVVTFGRMNPPTKGHAEMVKYVMEMAVQHRADHKIFASHTHDSKKNPIDYDEKVDILQSLFPEANIIKSPLKTPYQIMDDISEAYDKVYYVVGADRFVEFSKGFKQYYNNVEVLNSGARTNGISGTDQRNAAMNEDYESFKSGMPDSDEHIIKRTFDLTKRGLNG